MTLFKSQQLLKGLKPQKEFGLYNEIASFLVHVFYKKQPPLLNCNTPKTHHTDKKQIHLKAYTKPTVIRNFHV